MFILKQWIEIHNRSFHLQLCWRFPGRKHCHHHWDIWPTTSCEDNIMADMILNRWQDEKKKRKRKVKETKHLQIMQRLNKETNLLSPIKTWDISWVGCSYRPKEKNVLKIKIRTIGWKAEDHETLITITNINFSIKASVLHYLACVITLHSYNNLLRTLLIH